MSARHRPDLVAVAAGGATQMSGLVSELSSSEPRLRRFLLGMSGVDQVAVEARAGVLASRSVKADSKLWAIDTALSMVDLTTLEGADTQNKVRALCGKARCPDPRRSDGPRVAAVCVYPDLVATAKSALAGSGVAVASVATAFPSGRASRAVKLADVADAVDAGADEVDMVIDRGAFLSGRYGQVLDEVLAVRAACQDVHLKVILETGELVTYDNVRRAAWLAMLGGADFIKTSTGKVSPAATLPVAVVMLRAVREFEAAGGGQVGVKVAGGVRTTKDAIRYLVAIQETVGERWMSPAAFRIGASGLLNDLLMQRAKQMSGSYSGPEDFSVE